jgi:uncharacterized protein YbjT (DUF2867 family)
VILVKIVLIGAGGRVGSRLLKELLGRGQTVIGIARDTTQLASIPGPLRSGRNGKSWISMGGFRDRFRR